MDTPRATTTQGDFTVTIDSTNSPVVAGETLVVNATVSNSGTTNATQNVTLSVGGEVRAVTNVTLGLLESETVTLAWTTTEADTGNYTAEVATENDDDTTDVAVLQPDFFAVDIADTTDPVTAGGVLEVNTTIENTGNSSGEQSIVFAVDGDVQATTDVALDHGNSTTVTFSWATTSDDVGTHDIAVLSDNDRDFETVTVDPPPDVDVAITNTTSPVTEGEPLEVIATVVNTGNVSVTRTVTLSTADTLRDVTDVTLGPRDSKAVVLSWTTTSDDVGEYSVTVASDSDSDATLVTVNARPEGSFGYEPDNPSTGQPVTFEAAVSDPDGTIEGYEWRIDGAVVSTSRTATHTFDFAGEHEIMLVVTDDDGATTTGSVTITVSGDNLLPALSLRYAPGAPTTGEPVTFVADASDPDGSVARYEWMVDGTTVGTGPELRHTFESGGEHEVTVTVVDDEGGSTFVAETVAVNARPEATVEYAPTEPTVDQEVTFAATASDPDGNVTGYEWSVDGTTVGSGPELRHSFESVGEHEVTLLVGDDAGAATAVSFTVSVQPAPTPTATPTPTPTPTPESIPGFGLRLVGVALVAIALLVRSGVLEDA